MFGILVDFVNRAQSGISEKKPRLPGRGRHDEPETSETESTLYKCPACDVVYVAIEKTECGNCESTVEPVEADDSDSS